MRPSKAPGSRATVHEMDPETRARYEAGKPYGFGSVKGWSHTTDPWGITDWRSEDPWYKGRSRPEMWPPEGGRS